MQENVFNFGEKGGIIRTRGYALQGSRSQGTGKPIYRGRTGPGRLIAQVEKAEMTSKVCAQSSCTWVAPSNPKKAKTVPRKCVPLCRCTLAPATRRRPRHQHLPPAAAHWAEVSPAAGVSVTAGVAASSRPLPRSVLGGVPLSERLPRSLPEMLPGLLRSPVSLPAVLAELVELGVGERDRRVCSAGGVGRGGGAIREKARVVAGAVYSVGWLSEIRRRG